MEELDLKDLISYFMSKIIYFLAIVTLVVTLGCLYLIFLKTPVFTSKTSVILTGNNKESSSTITQTDLSVNSKLVGTYQEIVKSKRVLSQVIHELNLDYTVKDLSKMIRVGAINDTEIIEISVTNEENRTAYAVANKVAEIFSKEAKDLYNLSNVSILDRADIETVPSNINITKQLLIFLGLGSVLGFAVLFLFYYFDTTIKRVSDIERKYNLPILGAVPDYNKKKKKGAKRRWKMKL